MTEPQGEEVEGLDPLTRVAALAAVFVFQADLRADGTGDFDAYHSARHDLVMEIGDIADELAADTNDESPVPSA